MTAVTQWLVRWNIWPTESSDVDMFQGPYSTREEAEAAASAAYPTIDPWHDPSWALVCLYGDRLPGIRYVEPEHNVTEAPR